MPTTDLPTVQTNDALFATGAVLALLAILFVVVRVVRRWRAMRAVELSDPPPLLIPVQRRGSTPAPIYPARFGSEQRGDGALRGLDAREVGRAGIGASGDGIGDAEQAVGPARRNGHAAPIAGPVSDIAPATAGATVTKTNGGTASKVVHTIPPMDGTLQFLPGRLEVIDGETPGRDVRFVRTWGEVPEITFGRVTGPPYRHVQLRSQTVSRQHARMQYTDGRWKMTNLSQTNPVIINGEALETAHGTRVLRDGDQIEMGEVIFRFRER